MIKSTWPWSWGSGWKKDLLVRVHSECFTGDVLVETLRLWRAVAAPMQMIAEEW
jgi:GTP cyclohydrolase II